MKKKLRAPAYPLVVNDPYFSIWSLEDNLYDDITRHWTATSMQMHGIALLDGVPYRFMGKNSPDKRDRIGDIPVMEQAEVNISACSTEYTFKKRGIVLKVKFTSPLLMDDLEIMSTPISFVTFKASAHDDIVHDLKIYFDITAECCVNLPNQLNEVDIEKNKINEINVLKMGRRTQYDILTTVGDDQRIDWGFLYLTSSTRHKVNLYSGDKSCRNNFAYCGNPEKQAPKTEKSEIKSCCAIIDFKQITKKTKEEFLMLCYDDMASVEYFGVALLAYYRKSKTFLEAVVDFHDNYKAIIDKCNDFDKKLYNDAFQAGGEKYAQMCILGYRHTIAGHKLVIDKHNRELFLSKECFSNGCMGTVDVSYPSIPLFLRYNTKLAEAMLRPIFDYAKMDEWPYQFAPHDVGRYPRANGQRYGAYGDTFIDAKQMPLEECGDMLIMTAGVCKTLGNTKFVQQHFEQLKEWAEYQIEFGMDPGEQLCTDDFSGHLAHNVNLSAKAIISIACFGFICNKLEKEDDAQKYLLIAKEMARKWVSLSKENDHTKLAFDKKNTWSQKYNIVWDILFGFELFPKEIIENELKYYIKMSNEYGAPLDNRDSLLKVDWTFWCAAMTDKKEFFDKLINPVYYYLSITGSRVPFTDRYDTKTGYNINVRNRTVIGSIYIQILKQYWKNN